MVVEQAQGSSDGRKAQSAYSVQSYTHTSRALRPLVSICMLAIATPAAGI